MKTTEVTIDELKKERDDWFNIWKAYGESSDTGEALRSGKEARCGLCPKYKKEIIIGDNAILSCRECPIVKMTRRTCGHWWEHLGVDADNFLGKKDALKTYNFLEDLVLNAEVSHG